jgi:hypothetical protein
MKNVLFIMLSTIILLSSCSKEDLSNENDSENGLKSGQVLIKAYPGESKTISIGATADRISIDWGDGTVDELNPNGVRRSYSHEYANKNLQKIVVTGINLTSFSVTETNVYELEFGSCLELTWLYCFGNQLTVLDVSKCTELTLLDCHNNRLTSLDMDKCLKLIYLECYNNQLAALDMSQCKELRHLYCDGNQLSASALNDLFNSLPMQPDGSYGYIDYFNNPGDYYCNYDILIGKGWRLDLYDRKVGG